MDARLSLEQILNKGLIPEPPGCYCITEPNIDCPDHGSIQWHSQQLTQATVENFLLATVIRDIKAFADQLLDGGDTTVGQHLLHLLANHLDLTPLPMWQHLPWDDDVSPF